MIVFSDAKKKKPLQNFWRRKEDFMQRHLFGYKAFILTNLSSYIAFAVRKSAYSEGIFNAAAPGATSGTV